MAPRSILRTESHTLVRLLDEELVFSPSIQGIYSSHLAMALVALHQMGAPDEVLQRTLDAHARGHAERRDDRPELDRRLEEVRRDGIAATVRARAVDLVDAPDTALFHPLIRLGYGLDVGHPGQVAAALLDWENRHHTPRSTTSTPGLRRLPEAAADLAGHPVGTWSRTFDLDGLARRPEVIAALDGVAFDEHTLDDVSSFAIAAHVAADDFITLHLVTGARAMRTVSGWVDHDTARRLAAAALPVMAVAYAAVGAPPLLGPDATDAIRHLSLPSRDQIAELAIADRDPHVIKLAEVALAEEARTADPLYRFAAARVVGLVDRAADLVAHR